MRTLALSSAVVAALGAVIVLGAGWGGLWLYAYLVASAAAITVGLTLGGRLVRSAAGSHVARLSGRR